MPVSRKKKPITPASDTSTVEPSSPLLPSQQEFHAYLRSLAQSAVRTVIEAVMREELDAFIGVAWGECSPKRKGYRNGSYLRDLVTSTGQLEDIKVPRDREGQFHTQAFERYSRYEPHIAQGLTQMFVSGTSTHKVGEVAQTLMGVAPSASTISRLNQSLTQQFEAWRERPLQDLLAAMSSRAAPPVSTEALLQQEGLESLTGRELQILRLLDQDLTNKEIARELVLTTGTVKVHTSNVYRKLSVSNRRAAVTLAKALGFLEAG